MDYVGVLFAGGRGSRLQPYTNSVPKSIIPISGKPIIWYALQALRFIGISKVFILGGYKLKDIESYLNNNNNFGIEIAFQKDTSCCPLHALSSLEKYISSPFCLMHSDIILAHDVLKKMTKIFNKDYSLCVTAVSEFHKIATHPYSTLIGSKISNIVMRKPRLKQKNKSDKWFCWCGAYVFDPLVFNYLKLFKGGHGVPEMALANYCLEGKIVGWIHKDDWFHLGYKKDLRANDKGIKLSILNWYSGA